MRVGHRSLCPPFNMNKMFLIDLLPAHLQVLSSTAPCMNRTSELAVLQNELKSSLVLHLLKCWVI